MTFLALALVVTVTVICLSVQEETYNFYVAASFEVYFKNLIVCYFVYFAILGSSPYIASLFPLAWLLCVLMSIKRNVGNNDRIEWVESLKRIGAQMSFALLMLVPVLVSWPL